MGQTYKGARVAEFLGETKVNQVHSVAVSAHTHQKVVGFDIAVHKVAIVHELQASDLPQETNRLKPVQDLHQQPERTN